MVTYTQAYAMLKRAAQHSAQAFSFAGTPPVPTVKKVSASNKQVKNTKPESQKTPVQKKAAAPVVAPAVKPVDKPYTAAIKPKAVKPLTGLAQLTQGKYGDAPGTYTIQKGDTLWALRNRLAGTGWKGQLQQFKVNNPHILDYNKLKPGDVISLGRGVE